MKSFCLWYEGCRFCFRIIWLIRGGDKGCVFKVRLCKKMSGCVWPPHHWYKTDNTKWNTDRLNDWLITGMQLWRAGPSTWSSFWEKLWKFVWRFDGNKVVAWLEGWGLSCHLSVSLLYWLVSWDLEWLTYIAETRTPFSVELDLQTSIFFFGIHLAVVGMCW